MARKRNGAKKVKKWSRDTEAKREKVHKEPRQKGKWTKEEEIKRTERKELPVVES